MLIIKFQFIHILTMKIIKIIKREILFNILIKEYESKNVKFNYLYIYNFFLTIKINKKIYKVFFFLSY